MKKTAYRTLITVLLVVVCGILSNYLVRNTSISSFSIFGTISLFTYFGVLIGFSLTIYTFGLSMVPGIKQKIEELDEFSPEQKRVMFDKLISGFKELKQDIWLIFYALIVIVCSLIAKEFHNPFDWKLLEYKIPETIDLTLFLVATIAMSDIMRTLFNLSEINLELNKKQQAKKES